MTSLYTTKQHDSANNMNFTKSKVLIYR